MCAISAHFSQTKEKCTWGQYHWASLAAVLSIPAREGQEQGRLNSKQGTGLAFSLQWVCYLLFFDPALVLSGTQLPLPPFVFVPLVRDVSMVLYLFDLTVPLLKLPRLRACGLVTCSCSMLAVGYAAAGAHWEEPLCISSASALRSRWTWVEVY